MRSSSVGPVCAKQGVPDAHRTQLHTQAHRHHPWALSCAICAGFATMSLALTSQADHTLAPASEVPDRASAQLDLWFLCLKIWIFIFIYFFFMDVVVFICFGGFVCLFFLFPHCVVCRILVSQPGIEPMCPALGM